MESDAGAQQPPEASENSNMYGGYQTETESDPLVYKSDNNHNPGSTNLDGPNSIVAQTEPNAVSERRTSVLQQADDVLPRHLSIDDAIASVARQLAGFSEESLH